MGRVMRGELDLDRAEVLAWADDCRLMVDEVAALRHTSRSKRPNDWIHKAKRDHALTPVWEIRPDFGPRWP